jgi:hypothetical protein
LTAFGKLHVGLWAAIGLTLAACDREEEPRPLQAQQFGEAQETSGPASWLGAQNRTPPATWLASRTAKGDLGPEHPLVKECQRLLQEASKRFEEEPRMIANRAAQLEAMLASNGVNETAKSIIEAFINNVSQERIIGFSQMCQHYYNLRLAGRSREEALNALRKAYEGRDDENKTRP